MREQGSEEKIINYYKNFAIGGPFITMSHKRHKEGHQPSCNWKIWIHYAYNTF